jgi:hypothetical protein
MLDVQSIVVSVFEWALILAVPAVVWLTLIAGFVHLIRETIHRQPKERPVLRRLSKPAT